MRSTSVQEQLVQPLRVPALATPSARPRAVPLARPAVVAWLLSLLPFALLALLPGIPGHGLDADDYAQYLMHARALASGQPYGHILYIHSSLNPWVGPASMLPGLPVLLAPVLRLGGTALVPWVMLLVALAFVLLGGRYFAEHDRPWTGVGVALLCGLTPAVVFNATQPLSDLPFAALLWATALVADRPGRIGAGRIAAIAALGGAALLFRTAGVALVPTLLVLAFLRRRSGGALLALPVVIWVVAGAAALLAVDVHQVLLIRFPHAIIWMLRRHLLLNGHAYARAFLGLQPAALPWPAAATALRLLALPVCLLGLGAWVRRAPGSFATVFAAIYGAMLLVLPLRDDRYLWPLLPLLAFGLVSGIHMLASLMRDRDRAVRAAFVATAAVAVLAAAGVAAQPRPVSLGDVPDGRALFAYLRELKARGPVRVTFFKPRVLGWELGIPAMGVFKAPQAEMLRELCRKGITDVITGAPPPGRQRGLRRLTADRPDLFQPTYANPSFRVYHFVRRCPAGDAPGSEARR